MEAHHGHEVGVKNAGAESINLILEKEMELEQRLKSAKAEAERIVEEAKKKAQEIKSGVGKAAQKSGAEAGQPENGGQKVDVMGMTVSVSDLEREEMKILRENSRRNMAKVVEMILQEIVP